MNLSEDEKQTKVCSTNTLIVGAGAAGLAAAACLKREKIPFIIIEQANQVGSVWHRHYDRLHLHTDKAHSALPYLPFPANHPKYPARNQVVEYLETYTRHFELKPHFGQKLKSVQRQNGSWLSQTQDKTYTSTNLVIATGYTRRPHRPTWPGQDQFQGRILHSSEYKNGQTFRNQAVLVVGFGNSGGEIALDLWEHGAKPSLAVRSPVNIIPRDIFGIPVLAIGIVMRKLPAGLADLLSAPLIALTIGDLKKFGLRKLPYGPNTQIRRDGRIPLLDIGTVKLIKERQVKVYPGLERFTPDGVVFVDGQEVSFEALILATGYQPQIGDFLIKLEGLDQVVDAEGRPYSSGQESALPGLFFCGFYVSPTGMLREIALEAQKISQIIAQKALTKI